MALLRVAVCCSLWQAAGSFFAGAPLPAAATRTAEPMMGAAWAVEKKSKIVEEVKETMDGSLLMFCVRSEGISVNDMNMMRQKFPDDVTIRCVKNTLVKRAAEDFPRFQGGDALLKKSNYWFFVPETSMRDAVDTWNDWIKETKNDDNAIVGGIFEGDMLDAKGVAAVAKLPTKQEMMGKTAILLKALPTKLARTLNQAGAQRLAKVTKEAAAGKLVRAVQQMEGKK